MNMSYLNAPLLNLCFLTILEGDLQKPKVLIVENEISIALDLSDLLEEEINANVHLSSTYEFEKAFFQTLPDVLIIDCSPEFKFSDTVVNYLNHGSVRVIATTASSKAHPILEPIICGHFSKPIDPQELVKTVRSISSTLN